MQDGEYFFEVQAAEQGKDTLEVAASDQAAQEYADKVIRLLKEADGYDHHGLIMVVRNEAGQTLFAAPF
jgi:hypothetical protein